MKGIPVDRVRRFLEKIAETEQEEISCTECFDLLPECVDRELGGQAIGPHWPRLEQHLQQCAVCRDEYETLRDLVQLDNDDRPVDPDPSSS